MELLRLHKKQKIELLRLHKKQNIAWTNDTNGLLPFYDYFFGPKQVVGNNKLNLCNNQINLATYSPHYSTSKRNKVKRLRHLNARSPLVKILTDVAANLTPLRLEEESN